VIAREFSLVRERPGAHRRSAPDAIEALNVACASAAAALTRPAHKLKREPHDT
jgi:hypothetical protein